MELIKEIKKQKRGIYQLITANGAFLISESMLVDYHLYQGGQVSPETLLEIQSKFAVSYCYQQALALMARRDHFKQELTHKLQLREHSLASIKQVIEQLETEKIINEQAFAQRLTAEKATSDSYRKIKAYLINKGCPAEIAENALAELDRNEKSKAYQALLKKFNSMDIDQIKAKRDKILRHLAGQGYSYSDSKAAYQEFLATKKTISSC